MLISSAGKREKNNAFIKVHTCTLSCVFVHVQPCSIIYTRDVILRFLLVSYTTLGYIMHTIIMERTSDSLQTKFL